MSGPEIKSEKDSEPGNILGVLKDLVKDPCGGLAEWKATHQKKIIACMPMQIPEEIIHAAGALPVIIPESKEPVTIATKHIQNFFCGYARNIIDVTLKGKLDFLDGMIFQDTCHTMRPMFDIINANHSFPFMQRIFMPLALAKPQAKPFLLEELKRFKVAVERFTRCEITDNALQNSIRIYNENRKLMRSFYDLRRERPEIISAAEVAAVNVASMLMPKSTASY
jgi:benzoyl-CoA reductase subunit C